MLSLADSRSWCADVMRENATSFYWATRLLPSAKRTAIEAFYGLCRFADDLADEPGLTAPERSRLLQEVRYDVEVCAGGSHRSAFPWFAAFAQTVADFHLDVADACLLVEGCESDLGIVNVRTMDELERYASAVAGTVGRVTMTILGARDPDSLERGTRLGIAMQFTNVLRDIEVDAAIGRNYIPFDAFPARDEVYVLRTIAQRARTYYREALVLSKRVPNDGSRFAILLARSLYEQILNQIEDRGFNWRLGRAVVPVRRKVTLAARSFFDAYAGFATIK